MNNLFLERLEKRFDEDQEDVSIYVGDLKFVYNGEKLWSSYAMPMNGSIGSLIARDISSDELYKYF